MNDHPRELLPLIAEGAVPDQEVRQHLEACTSCTATLQALSMLDLGYVWEGVAAELDAPEPNLAERGFERIGVPASVARFVVTTPTLRGAWLLASLLVVGCAFAASILAPEARLSPVLLVAPLVAAGLVAFAYGPAADSAYEIVAATPLSPLFALLLRLAVVLSWSSVIVGVADLGAGSGRGALSWLLPMTCTALFAAAVGLRSQPVVGAASGMGVWMTLVIGAESFAKEPARFLWGSESQVVYALAVVLLLLLLSRWVVKGQGFVAPISFQERNGGLHAG